MSRIVLEPLQKSNLVDWFSTDTGRYTLQWEQAQVDSAVEDVFGFNAAQIGIPSIDYLRANRMPNRITIGRDPGAKVDAEATHLPIASSSLDLVVLPHVLEFCGDPHAVLREAERVLVPEGQIVIAGFNPLSLWGLRRLVGGRRREYPWRGEFIGLLRLRDWLKLLGFELNGGKFGCYAPPFAHTKWIERFRFMDGGGERWWPIAGGAYVVRAVKRVSSMRVITPAWRTRRSAAPALVSVASRTSRPSLRVVEGNRLAGTLMPPVPAQAPVLVPARDGPRDGRSQRDGR